MVLGDVAQLTMDLYYQDFKADEDFFDLEHFMYINSLAYAKVLQDYYEKEYARALAEKGRGDIEFDPSWLLEETVNLTRNPAHESYDGELSQKPFAFLGDNQDRAIQLVEPLDSNINLFRISMQEVWKLRHVPFTRNVFYYRLGGTKLRFAKVKGGLDKVKIYYMPQLADLNPEALLSDALGAMIVQSSMELMVSLRNGTPINMTNDQNPNKTMESEIDTAFRAIKTKS